MLGTTGEEGVKNWNKKALALVTEVMATRDIPIDAEQFQNKCVHKNIRDHNIQRDTNQTKQTTKHKT